MPEEHVLQVTKKKRKKKRGMPDQPVTLDRVPAILQAYNWMKASRTPRERIVMKALLVVWDAYCREKGIKEAQPKSWADKVDK